METGKGIVFFLIFITVLALGVAYLKFPQTFGRKCSCAPQCDLANLQINSCRLISNSLNIKLTNNNIVDLHVIIGYLVFPNKSYESRYLSDHIPSFTTKDVQIENIPEGISSFTITTECPNIKLRKNITDCYY